MHLTPDYHRRVHISNNSSNTSRLRKYRLAIAVVALISITSLIAWSRFSPRTNTETTDQQVASNQVNSDTSSSPKTPEVSKPESITLRTLFLGNVFWGRYIDDWSKASNLGTAYPFSGLSSFKKEQYDAWIAGLECPITSTYLDSRQQNSILKFSCLPEYTSEAAKWFEVFSLANNHMDNMEEVGGFSQTKTYLENNEIQYFGHFDSAQKEDICEVVSFKSSPVTKEKTSNQNTEYYIPIALCGFHNVFKLPTDDQINVITEYAKYLPTIVMPHQGKEYTYSADKLQRAYARKYIDKGADAVIGDHVHSVQDTEAYKGKLIVHSLGNFIFDQQRSPQVTQAMGVGLTFSFQFDENLETWLSFSESCQTFKDNCLQKAKELNLKKPQFTLNYHLVASDNSNKLTKKASDDVRQIVLEKSKWTETMKALGQD